MCPTLFEPIECRIRRCFNMELLNVLVVVGMIVICQVDCLSPLVEKIPHYISLVI